MFPWSRKGANAEIYIESERKIDRETDILKMLTRLDDFNGDRDVEFAVS